jgi:hypothetical protein
MYKNHPLNLDVTDIFELVTKVAQKSNRYEPHETSELVSKYLTAHTSIFNFYFSYRRCID